MEKDTRKKIHEDIDHSSIPEELKVVYLMANATDIMVNQSFERIKDVFRKNGVIIKENELLTGINEYCKMVKRAIFHFAERIEPQIIDATWGANEGDNRAASLDGFNEDANEVARLVMLYIDRCSRNNENYEKVFDTLGGLPSANIFSDEDISKYKLKTNE